MYDRSRVRDYVTFFNLEKSDADLHLFSLNKEIKKTKVVYFVSVPC